MQGLVDVEITALQQCGSGVPEPIRRPEVGGQRNRIPVRLSCAASEDHVLPHLQGHVVHGHVPQRSDHRRRVPRIEDAVPGHDDGAPAVLDQRPHPRDRLIEDHGVPFVAVGKLGARIDGPVQRVEADGSRRVTPRRQHGGVTDPAERGLP